MTSLLIYKILQLFAFMILGFVIVKAGVVKSEDSLPISKISLYLLMPAAIVNAFNVDVDRNVLLGVVIAFAVAILIHVALLGVDAIFTRLSGGSAVERASVVYSNSGNLIIPIVSFVLGGEWVIYSCAFLSVQNVFLWTHGIRLFSDGKRLHLKKILLNPNIIAVIFGIALMLSGLKLPTFVSDVASSLGSMLGAVSMLIAGMLATDIKPKQMLARKRIYPILLMRMIICPVLVLLMLTGICALMRSVGLFESIKLESLLLISFLATITPSASSVMQFAKINGKETDLAAAINIFSTVISILTMPLFVMLFEKIIGI